jgi:hypothetical protein
MHILWGEAGHLAGTFLGLLEDIADSRHTDGSLVPLKGQQPVKQVARADVAQADHPNLNAVIGPQDS